MKMSVPATLACIAVAGCSSIPGATEVKPPERLQSPLAMQASGGCCDALTGPQAEACAERVAYIAGLARTDLNGDGQTDGLDMGLLLGAWGTDDPAADLNADGTVDGIDLGILLGGWNGIIVRRHDTGDGCLWPVHPEPVASSFDGHTAYVTVYGGRIDAAEGGGDE